MIYFTIIILKLFLGEPGLEGLSGQQGAKGEPG